MKNHQTEKGIVKWFNASRGYGFIVMKNGIGEVKDVFVHAKGIVGEVGSVKTLSPGDEVEFEVEQTDRGERARRVVVIRRTTQRAEIVSRRD